MLNTVTVDEVLRIHEILTADFARADDPISPAGLRDAGLLESAVARQFTGNGSTDKYPGPLENAATLFYGVCSNHAFHNGNKRTALVVLLVHLDKNGLTLRDTSQKDLFRLVLDVASHELVPTKGKRPSSDAEVEAVTKWLRSRAVKPHKGERQITFRELRRRLAHFGFELVVSSSKGNAADIIKQEERPRLFRKATTERKRIGTIGYRDEGTLVAVKDLKLARKLCRLSEADGVDSHAFYDSEARIDGFINAYRKVLERLAKR